MALSAALEASLEEALVALQQGDMARGRSIYDGLLAAGCADVRMFSNLGAIALQEGDGEAAIPWLERGLALQSDHPRCLLNLGMALKLQGRTVEAIAALRRAASRTSSSLIASACASSPRR